jgi:hypothetical protein
MEYRNKGVVWHEPVVGERFMLIRSERDGVEALGFFTTSSIVEIVDKPYGCDLHTENSIYRVTRLKAGAN